MLAHLLLNKLTLKLQIPSFICLSAGLEISFCVFFKREITAQTYNSTQVNAIIFVVKLKRQQNYIIISFLFLKDYFIHFLQCFPSLHIFLERVHIFSGHNNLLFFVRLQDGDIK